jgi:putative MATE family efflux protein
MTSVSMPEAKVKPATTAAVRAAHNPLLTGAILPTLVKLALPNLVSILFLTAVVVAETIYIGRLGTEALAAMALVFPMIMMTQQMSSGAMGGGVSSAIARAIGAGDEDRARALAMHAILIGIGGGLVFMGTLLTFGPAIYRLLGGQGEVLRQALLYSNTLFTGVIAVWLLNTLASIVRGTGNMTMPSKVSIGVGLTQAFLGGCLALGIGRWPKLGIAGVALAQVLAYSGGVLVLFFYLLSGKARIRIGLSGVTLNREMFLDILKVGAVACLSSLQSVLTVLIAAGLVARYGTAALAGYGIGVRLEFLLIPIAFGFGTACVPMVGMAIGAGQPARARRVAWTGATLSGCLIAIIGLGALLNPDLWAQIFTSDPQVRAAASDFLRWAGLGFPFFGFGLCLYFASQGSGKVLGVVAASTVRLLVVAVGGWFLVRGEAPFWGFAMLIGLAHFFYGIASGTAVKLTRWGR